MAAAKEYGSVKRFGARYGRRVKHKLAEIEKERKRLKTCPYCHKKGIKRISAGIWHCGKCKAKFTGKAYSPGKKVIKGEATVAKEAAA